MNLKCYLNWDKTAILDLALTFRIRGIRLYGQAIFQYLQAELQYQEPYIAHNGMVNGQRLLAWPVLTIVYMERRSIYKKKEYPNKLYVMEISTPNNYTNKLCSFTLANLVILIVQGIYQSDIFWKNHIILSVSTFTTK